MTGLCLNADQASRRAKFLGHKSGLCKQQQQRRETVSQSASSSNTLACSQASTPRFGTLESAGSQRDPFISLVSGLRSVGEETFLAEAERKSSVSRAMTRSGMSGVVSG